MKKTLFIFLAGFVLTGCVVYHSVPVGSENLGYTYDLSLPVEGSAAAVAVPAATAVVPTVAVEEVRPTPPVYSEIPEPPTTSRPQPRVVAAEQQIIRESAGAQPGVGVQSESIAVPAAGAAPVIIDDSFPVVTDFVDGTNDGGVTVTNVTNPTNQVAGTNVSTNAFTSFPTNQGTNQPSATTPFANFTNQNTNLGAGTNSFSFTNEAAGAERLRNDPQIVTNNLRNDQQSIATNNLNRLRNDGQQGTNLRGDSQTFSFTNEAAGASRLQNDGQNQGTNLLRDGQDSGVTPPVFRSNQQFHFFPPGKPAPIQTEPRAHTAPQTAPAGSAPSTQVSPAPAATVGPSGTPTAPTTPQRIQAPTGQPSGLPAGRSAP